MNTIAEIAISELSRNEKVELLQRLVKDLGDSFSGIEKTAGVCGGAARIRQTRVPVWVLENARRQGVTESELLQDYSTLTAQDLVNAWAYVRLHSEEIDRDITENEED